MRTGEACIDDSWTLPLDQADGFAGRVHSSLSHCHEDDLAVGYREGGRDGLFLKFGLWLAVWVYVFHDLDLLTSSQCFLVQPHTTNGRVPAQSERTGSSTRRNGPWVTGPAFRSFDHGYCNASVWPTRDARTAGPVVNSGLGSFTPPGVESNKASSAATWTGPSSSLLDRYGWGRRSQGPMYA